MATLGSRSGAIGRGLNLHQTVEKNPDFQPVNKNPPELIPDRNRQERASCVRVRLGLSDEFYCADSIVLHPIIDDRAEVSREALEYMNLVHT